MEYYYRPDFTYEWILKIPPKGITKSHILFYNKNTHFSI